MTRERKSVLAGVGVLIFTVILAGVAVIAHTTSEPEPEWLMVMNAETGEFQKDTTGEDYTLSLTGLSAGTLAFTDRPERQAQTWDTAAFLDAWASEFGDDPPNAVMSANGVRVAATVIDLWELLGVLVTVTNTTDHQRELDLGEVELVKVDFQNPSVRPQTIPLIDPESIDRVQKELSIWSLTHTRPWLANIQKTRTVRGFVPSKGHDLFRGPNVFGVYGKWKAVSHTVPQRVGLQPSRERVLDKDSPTEQALPGLLVKGNYQAPGVVPVWLEPFESRTGELFCLNPRDCDVVIKVPVGNAVFELPFHTRKKFPH